ncbi:MAG: LysR family transcriptional regulator [Ruminococcus sp.]
MQENLSLYHIFYTVSRTGNISTAAKELYISQPAISRAIKKLESNLDTTLFKRSSRGVTLTPDGQILYEKVKGAFDLLSEGEIPFFTIVPERFPGCASVPAPLYANMYLCPG